eukprot:jgi/Orpsp1_1/1177261/evm.model.c7180000060716.1
MNQEDLMNQKDHMNVILKDQFLEILDFLDFLDHKNYIMLFLLKNHQNHHFVMNFHHQ